MQKQSRQRRKYPILSMSEILWIYSSMGPDFAFEALDAKYPLEGAMYINMYCLLGPDEAADYLWDRLWVLFEMEQNKEFSTKE